MEYRDEQITKLIKDVLFGDIVKDISFIKIDNDSNLEPYIDAQNRLNIVGWQMSIEFINNKKVLFEPKTFDTLLISRF